MLGIVSAGALSRMCSHRKLALGISTESILLLLKELINLLSTARFSHVLETAVMCLPYVSRLNSFLSCHIGNQRTVLSYTLQQSAY